MGEKTILVCDVCNRPAAQTVTIKIGRSSLVKDLCGTHLSELRAGARRPRPGRRKGIVAAGGGAPKRRGRPPKSASGGTGRRRGRPPKSGAKRRGRPRKTAT